MTARRTSKRPKARGLPAPAPAPGELRLLQEFVNTRDPSGSEQLSSPAVLADWLASHGLIPADLELGAAERERVVAFREGLRALFSAGGTGVDHATVERVNRAAKGARVQLRIGPGGVPRVDALAKSLDDAFGRWLAILLNAHAEGTLGRLKICPNPACGILYYDDSRSHARRWCTKRCGDALRARAYRRSERYKRLRG